MVSNQRGATYLALLIAVALLSGLLATAATYISHAQRREREKQLLWVGEQFRRALLDYARAGPGQADFPERLEELLEDRRGPTVRRFLRRLYHDPLTGGTDWGLHRDGRGRIVGVHSRSPLAPIKQGRFPPRYAGFAQARSYAEWTFAAAPGAVVDEGTAAMSFAGVPAAGSEFGGAPLAPVVATTPPAIQRPPALNSTLGGGASYDPFTAAPTVPNIAPGRRLVSEPSDAPAWRAGGARP